MPDRFARSLQRVLISCGMRVDAVGACHATTQDARTCCLSFAGCLGRRTADPAAFVPVATEA